MKKTTLTLFLIVLVTGVSLAQSVDDGIKFLYYERYKSAIETLEKVVASNSKDPRSIYWLGQAYIDKFGISHSKDDLAKAKDLYQKALNDGINDPWIWVGMGHVEILEGTDINAVRQRFEQAITATTATKGKNKGKPDPDILNAIGRANADGKSFQGDPMYGIEKLKLAAQLNTTDPDIDINLGTCYLKLGSDKGGEAVEAFTDATVRDPKYAKAYYKIGRIYQSQNNTQFMNEWYAKAIAADANYGPVYLTYFEYYKEKDVNAAKEYLDKYVANADQDCSVDYFVAEYLFRAGKNQESLDKLNAMVNGTCKDYVRTNVLYAYNYDRLGDSLKAKSYIETFFSKADSASIDPRDYIFAGKLMSKFPGSEDVAAGYYEQAIQLDTVKSDKIEFYEEEAKMFAKSKAYDKQLNALINGVNLKADTSSTDFFYICQAAISAKKCDTATVFSNAYITKYPDQSQAYYFNVGAAKMCDADTSQGLAVDPIMKYNEFLSKDTEKNKKTIFLNYYYLLIYYAQYAKDLQKGVDICDSMMVLYPDSTSEEYTFAKNTKDQLSAALQKSGGSSGSTSGSSSSAANKSSGSSGKQK